MSLNVACVSGNLTKEAELRRTASGTAILKFTVAVNESKKNSQTGEWESVANFIQCTMFGKYAEKISESLHKGTKVAVCGKLHQNSWEKDGKKFSNIEIVVNEIELPARGKQTQEPKAQEQESFDDYYDDDLPF